MIYLIGGVPRTGKSAVAKKLAKRLNIPWIPADSLEGIPKFYFSGKEYAKKFPKDIMRRQTHYSNDEMYIRYTSNQIRSAYIKQAESVWVAVERLADDLINEGYDFIIEGYQMPPKQVSRLQRLHKGKIKSVFLVKLDPVLIQAQATRYTTKDDWFTAKTRNPKIFTKIAAMLSGYGKYIEKEAKRYKLKTFNMEKNFPSQVTATINYLTK